MIERLVHDWNQAEGVEFPITKPVLFNDETLRDGLQCPTVHDPTIDEKKQLLHLMAEIGIDMADLGLPGAGPRAVADVLALAAEIGSAHLNLQPNCAARTTIRDIDPILEIVDKTGVVIAAATFIGSSLIRQYVEGWSLDDLLKRTEEAVTYAVKRGLPVIYVTEDTTRAFPETIKKLYSTAIRCGARNIVLTDTVGYATPAGARSLVKFIFEEVVRPSGVDIVVEWHGHNDRGLSVISAIAAVSAGANVVHGCALGIGERVGNTPLDQVLVNMTLLGIVQRDLRRLKDYVELVSRACHVAVPPGYPVFGEDAFRTATGVHAAAVIKALRKGELDLADSVYSSVPARLFGKEQVIDIGPMSGKSNVVYWLEKRGIEPTEERVNQIYNKAKQASRLLNADEILETIGVSTPAR